MTITTKLRDEYHSLLLESAAKVGSESAVDIATISWSDNVDAHDDGSSTAATPLPKSITPADTLLVIDVQEDFLPGGAFGVAEGDSCLDGICELIEKFHQAGATVIATREYHPKNHCSFMAQGGPFPDHCVVGTQGSFLASKIASTLQPLLAAQEGKSESDTTTHVVYKGIFKDIDSFGAFPYDESETEEWKKRIAHSSNYSNGSSLLEWTGAYALYASNLVHDANAPPDAMSVLEKRPISDLLPASKHGQENNGESNNGRTFVCGLAYDYCVIDSAVNYCNYAKKKNNNNNNDDDTTCFIVQDLTRAAHLPGFGKFGTGFLTDPEKMLDGMKSSNIGLVRFVD